MSSSFKVQEQEISTLESSNFSYFNNQISGHSCLLKGSPNSQYIYKPYNRSEADFYEIISKNKEHALYNFIPAYYDTVQLPKAKLEEFASKITREESVLAEGIDLPNEVDIQSHNAEEQPISVSDTLPTSFQSRTEWFKSLFLKRFNGNNTRFLQLEDLTTDIQTPCMLDLKMGSVAYNAEKLAHQVSKLSKTTSSSLKFRVCGLQVKNPKTDTEFFRDKYWGRELQPEEINSALASFYYDGQTIRRNVLKHFIKLLQDLSVAVKECAGFKFYSVSLLLTYDSSLDDADYDESGTCYKDKIKLKLIDFAKTVTNQHPNEADVDLLTGIDSLIKSFTYIQENPEIKPYVA